MDDMFFDRMYDLLIPKLESISNSGQADKIHTARNFLLVIESSNANAKYWKKVGDYAKYTNQINFRNEKLQEAENWMVSLVQGIK